MANMDQVNDSFRLFISKSEQVGDVVAEVAKLVEKAFQSHLGIVNLAQKAKKPSNEVLAKVLKKTSDIVHDIETFKHKYKTSQLFNHLAAIGDSIPALGWVAVSPTPAPYVKELADAAQFYTNKVLVAYKDKDKLHVEWVNSWLSFLQELQKYIRQCHTTGLTWNPRGADLNQSGQLDGMSACAPPCAPPPPPPMCNMPPPPPPPPMSMSASSQLASGDDARAALLRDLNQGTDITKTLRKVTLEERQAQLKAGGADRSSRSKTPDPRAGSAASQRPPKFEFEGRKWLVEYQDGSKQQNFTIEATEMNQSVNVYRCEAITLTIKGKINSITVDSCKKLTLAFEDIVSFVEFINCQKIQAYPLGHVATITVDKTEAIQLFLRKKSLDVEIISAKSSEINACIVDEATGDYKEHPLPEQLKTIWQNNQFKTVALDKA